MSAQKTYAWERQTFQKQVRVNVQTDYRTHLTMKLAKHFGIKGVQVSLNTRGGGWCRQTYWGYQIALPRHGCRCPLSIIIHELAHAYSGQNESIECHHNKKFKHNLIKLMVESWKLLPRMFAEIRRDLALAELKLTEVVNRETIKAQKAVVVKEYKKSREYRMELVRARIKRLERKGKAIGTRLKSAKRSLMMMERMQARAGVVQP